jgi:diphthine synthase
MTLHMIGTGLGDAKDITVKGLEIVKKSKLVYLESYTSMLYCSKETLEKAWGKKLILADRDMVEKGCEEILTQASKDDVTFLVVGDPLSATTHMDLYIRAKKKGIEVDIVNNASILTAVGIAGLELYKYGKTTSIVFPQEGWNVETYYDVVMQNKKQGLHTLCLLDIKTKEPDKKELLKEIPNGYEKPRFMTVNEAIQCLLDVEKKRKKKAFTGQTLCVGCARLGSDKFKIKAGKANDIIKEEFGGPLHCLIIPGKLHFMEEEALSLWK